MSLQQRILEQDPALHVAVDAVVVGPRRLAQTKVLKAVPVSQLLTFDATPPRKKQETASVTLASGVHAASSRRVILSAHNIPISPSLRVRLLKGQQPGS